MKAGKRKSQATLWTPSIWLVAWRVEKDIRKNTFLEVVGILGSETNTCSVHVPGPVPGHPHIEGYSKATVLRFHHLHERS
jgi:hypothetical protein